MAVTRYVAYYRVSTDTQGRSGLGLQAQQAAVRAYIAGLPHEGRIVAEFEEVETGKNDRRPQLENARRLCRLRKATLVIAKLDRLSRNAAFLLALQQAGVPIVAADLPNADPFVFGIMAMVAQWERTQISSRTKAALAAKRERGWKPAGRPGGVPAEHREIGSKLGNEAKVAKANHYAEDMRCVIEDLRQQGILSLGAIAAALNGDGHPAPRGGTWSKTQVARLLQRQAA